MISFTMVFALVLLSGSEAALPNVGSCSFMEYYCNARKCNTRFYKQLQEDPKGDCSAKYNQMLKCVSKTIHICTENKWTDSQVNGILRQSFKENALCFEGSLEIPTVPPSSISSPCSASFSSDANACLKTFHEKFAANKSDPSLCQEQAKAKHCMKKLIDSNCTFPSLVQEALNLSFGDYNPFCANNRDPGATGSDQCHGFLPGPTQSYTTLFSLGQSRQSTLPHEFSDAKTRKNKSDVITVKQYILLFLPGLYFALV